MMKTERYLTGYEAAKERAAREVEQSPLGYLGLGDTTRKFWDRMFDGIKKDDIDWVNMKVKR